MRAGTTPLSLCPPPHHGAARSPDAFVRQVELVKLRALKNLRECCERVFSEAYIRLQCAVTQPTPSPPMTSSDPPTPRPARSRHRCEVCNQPASQAHPPRCYTHTRPHRLEIILIRAVDYWLSAARAVTGRLQSERLRDDFYWHLSNFNDLSHLIHELSQQFAGPGILRLWSRAPDRRSAEHLERTRECLRELFVPHVPVGADTSPPQSVLVWAGAARTAWCSCRPTDYAPGLSFCQSCARPRLMCASPSSPSRVCLACGATGQLVACGVCGRWMHTPNCSSHPSSCRLLPLHTSLALPPPISRPLCPPCAFDISQCVARGLRQRQLNGLPVVPASRALAGAFSPPSTHSHSSATHAPAAPSAAPAPAAPPPSSSSHDSVTSRPPQSRVRNARRRRRSHPPTYPESRDA